MNKVYTPPRPFVYHFHLFRQRRQPIPVRGRLAYRYQAMACFDAELFKEGVPEYPAMV